jgi:putative oxidoreductase
MNKLRQSSEGEGSRRVAFLKGPLLARWAPIPLRLIVGYGFMQHGFANCRRGPKASQPSCMR